MIIKASILCFQCSKNHMRTPMFGSSRLHCKKTFVNSTFLQKKNQPTPTVVKLNWMKGRKVLRRTTWVGIFSKCKWSEEYLARRARVWSLKHESYVSVNHSSEQKILFKRRNELYIKASYWQGFRIRYSLLSFSIEFRAPHRVVARKTCEKCRKRNPSKMFLSETVLLWF